MFEAKATKLVTNESEAKDTYQSEENEQTERFPHELPMENRYLLPRYFVRSCYPEYYDLILEKLGKFDVVTVTGTPGIGKSVFYGYFFERCKSGKTIIAVSFSKYSVLKEVVVFRDGRQVARAGPLSYNLIEEQREAALQRKDKLLFLYDGPPQFEPKYPSKMVCFTSPNEYWESTMHKKPGKCTLYMPLWGKDELLNAAERLRLHALIQKIEERFFFFGGVARGCLSRSDSHVSQLIKNLEIDINGMSRNGMRRLLDGVLGRHTIYQIYHYQPKPDNTHDFDIRIASKFVARLVLENIATRNYKEGDVLIRHLHRIPEAAAVRRGFFEIKVHELMVRGAKFETQCISEMSGSDSKNVVFNCKKTSNGFVFFDEKDLSSRTLGTGPYHIPRAVNYESVDSFYYPFRYRDGVFKRKKVILLFQMIESRRDPVQGKGIVTMLQAVGLMDKVMADPERVALIFVRTYDSEQDFADKQEISWDPPVDTELVDIIPNIGKAKTEALRKAKIENLGDLRSHIDEMESSGDSLLKQSVADYKEFTERQILETEMLAKIPQYVWMM